MTEQSEQPKKRNVWKNRGWSNQTIRRCNYWRCEVKDCTRCRLVLPLSNFNKNQRRKSGLSEVCKRCKQVEWKKRSRQPHNVKYYKRKSEEYRKNPANRQKIRDAQNRWAKKNKERYYLLKKLAEIRRAEKRGISNFTYYTRTPRGRMRLISTFLKRNLGIRLSPAQCAEALLHREDYIKAYKRWKRKAFARAYAPLVKPRRKGEADLKNFRVVTAGQLRSLLTKELWKNGKYKDRKLNPRKHRGLDKRSHDGKFVRGGHAVPLNETQQRLEA